MWMYILLSYGLSNLIVYANGPFHVFEKWREISHNIGEQFGELFTCMMCFSTWVGLALSLVNSLLLPAVAFTPFNIILGSVAPFWFIMILDMGFTSAVVWLIHQLEEMMERTGNVVYEDEVVE
jgi:tryptophan-rich sensory protein